MLVAFPELVVVADTPGCPLGNCETCTVAADCFDFDPCTIDTCYTSSKGENSCWFQKAATCCEPLALSCGSVAGCGSKGFVDSSSGLSVSDVQCGLLLNLWILAGYNGAAPTCATQGHTQMDMDCSGEINVADVVAQIEKLLDPSSEVDTNGNGCPDVCESAP